MVVCYLFYSPVGKKFLLSAYMYEYSSLKVVLGSWIKGIILFFIFVNMQRGAIIWLAGM